MAFESQIVRLIEFADTDMAGIMHFTGYYRYMEAAEHSLFRSQGLSVHGELNGQMIVWPRVHASCDFRAPLRFEDEVEIHVLVREKTAKSITCIHTFRKIQAPEKIEVAHGIMTLACAELHNGQMKSIPIPPQINRLIEVAPTTALDNR